MASSISGGSRVTVELFYRKFEEKHRGSQETITQRLKVYLPFIEPLKSVHPDGLNAFDIGCGRGEWLELIEAHGFSGFGMDLNSGMLAASLEKGLDVKQGDAVEYLAQLPEESQAVISAFHVVEHISFQQLQSLVSEAYRVLLPGGILILETPNPENIIVGTNYFYLDPTHKQPIPPLLLNFLPEYYGYARSSIVRLHEPGELKTKENISLIDVLGGVSPDYALVAQKNASSATMKLFDDAFYTEYGLTLSTLSQRREQYIERQFGRIHNETEQKIANVTRLVTQAEQRAGQAEQRAGQAEQRAGQAEQRAGQAEQRASQAEQASKFLFNEFVTIQNSRSWRMTKPLRWVGRKVRWLRDGSKAWLFFYPDSRPRRNFGKLFLKMKAYLEKKPSLKKKGKLIVKLCPPVAIRISSFVQLCIDSAQRADQNNQQDSSNYSTPLEALSPQARRIYDDLKEAIAKHSNS